MTARLPNISVPGSTAALLATTDDPVNLTAAQESLVPLCALCSCGVFNHTFAVAFMVSLAFAIVVGNVVTLAVFVRTRQSRTPQGYLKGNGCEPCHHLVLVGSRLFHLRRFLNLLFQVKINVNLLVFHSNKPQHIFIFHRFNVHTKYLDKC